MGDSNQMTFSIVYNNIAFDKETTLAWGMACVVEGVEKSILFDTGGDGSILLANMKVMGIDPEDAGTVVLSHIHGDHTGGLGSFLAANPAVTVCVPRSFPENFKHRIKARQARLVEVSEPVEICSQVYSTGELGVEIREQALIVKTGEGMVLVTGCAHAGVGNMVKRALELFNGDMHLVTGGFHLGGAAGDEIKRIIEELKQCGVKAVGPSHCTGTQAIEKFRGAWGDGYVSAGCGAVIEVPRKIKMP